MVIAWLKGQMIFLRALQLLWANLVWVPGHVPVPALWTGQGSPPTQQPQALLEKATPSNSYQGGYRAENFLEDVIYILIKCAPYCIQSFLVSYIFFPLS